MNTLLDIYDILSDAYPVVVIFLFSLLLMLYWKHQREDDHETRLRREWDEIGYDAWLELWDAQEQPRPGTQGEQEK